MFQIDDREIKGLERKLGELNERAIPFATRHTINTVAFNTMRTAKLNARVKMTMRNKWTEQSIRVERSKSLEIKRQAASVGSVADYMEDQEFGTTRTKKGRHGVPIATGYAAGQEGQQPRTRLPRKANKLANIRTRRGRKSGTNRVQRNKVAILQAAESGDRFVFLDLGRRRGLFRLVGGKRRPRIKMVYDLSRTAVNIPRNPWLQPSVQHEAVKLPGVYEKALRFQIDRMFKR